MTDYSITRTIHRMPAWKLYTTLSRLQSKAFNHAMSLSSFSAQ